MPPHTIKQATNSEKSNAAGAAAPKRALQGRVGEAESARHVVQQHEMPIPAAQVCTQRRGSSSPPSSARSNRARSPAARAPQQ
eukprot:2705957-Lingulodinium_polyedra.AAC.1